MKGARRACGRAQLTRCVVVCSFLLVEGEVADVAADLGNHRVV